MDLGLHTTLMDSTSKLDPEVLAISKRITPSQAREFGVVWDLFTTRPEPFQTDEFEIMIRQYTTPEVEVTATGAGNTWDLASATTNLPVSSQYISRITIGDVLMVENEVVVVKSVDRSANTIDVYERGAGETTAVAHGTATITAKVIGNAHEEGKADAEAMAEGTDKFTNYLQLVQEEIDLSKANTDQARKVGRTEDVLKAEAMERIINDLARTAIYGVSRENTADRPGMTRGLLQWLSLSGGLTTNVSGAFTQTVLDTALDEIRMAGGSPTAIVMSVANKRVFNSFTSADQVKQDVRDNFAGRVLDYYLSDGFGGVPVIVDINMPNDKIAIVDSRKLVKGWKINDQLKFSPRTDVNPRENKTLLHGKFGLAVENIGTSHHLLTGITTS